MDPLLPKVDLDLDEQWYLVCNRLGFNAQKHFTALHDRFNIKKFPLQDPFAFRRDVYECADDAETPDQFYSNLENRMAQRFREVSKAWENICKCLSSSPEHMKVDLKPGSLNDSLEQRLVAFTRFTRTMSFDSMVVFFDGFARDEREEEEEERRSRKERMNSIRRERAAKRLAAASRSIELDAANSTPNSSSRTAGTKSNSFRDALTLSTPTSTATTISDKPLPTLSSRRRSMDQTETLARARTTESSTGGKRRIEDEDTNGSERKKRCVMSEGARIRDVERPPVGQYKWRAAEATPTSKQAGKCKKIRCSPGRHENKRPRMINDVISSFRQPPERAADLYEFERDMTPPGVTRVSSLCSVVVQPGYDPDTSDEEGIQVGLRTSIPNSPVSTDDNLSFTTAESLLNEDTGGTVTNQAPKGYSNAEPGRELRRPFNKIAGFMAKISTGSADTREFKRRPRPPRRQQVNERQPRGEQKKQNASSSVQRILRSSRSSRRDPGQELLFLSDNGTACVVTSKGRK